MDNATLLFLFLTLTMLTSTLFAIITSFFRSFAAHLSTMFFTSISSGFALTILFASNKEGIIIALTGTPIGLNLLAIIHSTIQHYFIKPKRVTVGQSIEKQENTTGNDDMENISSERKPSQEV